MKEKELVEESKLKEEFIKKAKQGYFDKFINGRGEIDEEKAFEWFISKLNMIYQQGFQAGKSVIESL